MKPCSQQTRIYPYPMVWPLQRPWSETMVSTPPLSAVNPMHKGSLSLARPFLDLVSQTPRPRGGDRPPFADVHPPKNVSPALFHSFAPQVQTQFQTQLPIVLSQRESAGMATLTLPSGPPGLHALLNYFWINSMLSMTGRPGYWTMEMNGGSSAPYLACTPCIPLFVHCSIRVEAEGLLDYQGRAGIISIVRWNLRPVIFSVDLFPFWLHLHLHL